MEILSVSYVNNLAKKIIEEMIGYISIKGEISKATLHSSGHFYFTLKDDKSSLDAVIFKNNLRYISQLEQSHIIKSLSYPKSGEVWICEGQLSIWGRTGRYIFKVDRAIPAGRGEIFLRFLALKEKLKDEGLFDDQHKKILPYYPLKVGVITSETGAAIRDIIKVGMRRFPSSEILISPSIVQGEKAPKSLIRALQKLFKTDVEVIIIARGGGAPEDLACFNNEDLARHVFHSEIPIVSAIGHQIDQTIVDFVADVSAATPSAAAEIVFPDGQKILKDLIDIKNDFKSGIKRKLQILAEKIFNVRNSYSFRSIPGKVEELRMILDNSSDGIKRIPVQIINNYNQKLNIFKTQIKPFNLIQLISQRKSEIEILKKRMFFKIEKTEFLKTDLMMIEKRFYSFDIKSSIEDKKFLLKRVKNSVKLNMKRRLKYLQGLLSLKRTEITNLAPHRALKKGYSIVYDPEGKLVTRGKIIESGKLYDIKFYDLIYQMESKKEKK